MAEVQKYLDRVYKDMPVYDSTGEKIGKVSFVHRGVDEYVADWSIKPADAALSEAIPPAVLDELPGGIPEEAHQRMLQTGFVKIKTGLLSATRYVLPRQIAIIGTDVLYLNVEKDDLAAF